MNVVQQAVPRPGKAAVISSASSDHPNRTDSPLERYTAAAAGAPDPVVTREGLSRALDAVNERMQPGDVDALFRLLDTDGSGVLTKDELGLRGEAAEAVAHYHGGQARVPPPPQGV